MSFFTSEEMVDFSLLQRSKLRRYWLRNYVDNLKRVESDKDVRQLPDLGFGKPAAVLGGAPIEPDTFELLKSMDCVTTVACDKALPRVLPYYRPKFVVALNTQKTEAVELEKWFVDTEGMGLIVPLTVHPETVRLWKGTVYWMNPTNIDDDLCMRIEQETGIPRWHRGLNAGEFATTMAAFMRPAEIDLFGMWYAWKNREDVSIADPENYDIVEIVDNGERWWASLAWLNGRSSFIQWVKSLYPQGIAVYNCSVGGILYHPDYCKPSTPQEFKERWVDIPPTSDQHIAIVREPDDNYQGD